MKKVVAVRAVVAGAVLLFATELWAGEDDLPWAFNDPRAEGYTIDLVSVDPAPGTPLLAGTSVEFKITVNYSLSVSKTGAIALVFQDEKNRSAKSDDAEFVQVAVSAPEGIVMLTDTVVVPKQAKELRLFVPLMPDGLKKTHGEVTIRYPIRKK